MAKKIKPTYGFKSRKEASEPSLLYLMFTLGGKQYKISTGFKVAPMYWDKENNRVFITSQQKQIQQREMKRVNRFIDALEKEISTMLDADVLADYEKKLVPNAVEKYGIVARIKEKIDKIKGKEIKEEEKRTITVLDYFKKVVEEMPKKVIKRTGKFIEAKTIQHHTIVLKRFENFLNYKHYGNGSFSMFNKNFESEMEQWMLGEKNYTPNTVCATFSVMKIWLKMAEDEGLISDKSFHSWKSKGYDVQHIYLTEEELKAIYNFDFSEYKKVQHNSVIEEVRDLFILASQIGLRYGDLERLNASNWDIENRTVEIHTKKTSETVLVPLSTIAIEIYRKYKGVFPKPQDKGKYNANLERIGRMVGLTQSVFVKSNAGGKIQVVEKKKYEMISSHTARRSFATNLYKRCHNCKMVMAFTGHKTEENFKKYICIEQEEMVNMAKSYFD